MITAARLRRARKALRLRGIFKVAAWTVLFLIVADVGLNVAFRRPASPRVKPDGIKGYLAYGYSTEGKLKYMVGPTDKTSAPLVPVGWIQHGAITPNLVGHAPDKTARLRMNVFGMSFSNHISNEMAKLDPTLAVMQYAGPAAPPNHSFALYREVRRLGDKAPPADVVVLGILASSVKGMVTETGMTWMFEAPAPFCYPRYTLDNDGKLIEHWPPIRTEAELRDAVKSPAKMTAFRDELAANDRFYDSMLFGGSWADRSALVRMVRRALADHHISAVTGKIERTGGFAEDDTAIGPPLRAMCREFADTARADGRKPIVLLIQDQGSADHLYQLLAPSLDAAGIPYCSTHEIVKTNDRSNFISDGHFTPACDRKVAKVLLSQINALK